MKLYKSFCTILMLILFSVLNGQNKITIGKRLYTRTNKGYFIKEEGIWVKSVNYSTKGYYMGFTCNSISERNDSVFMKGDFEINYNKKIVKCKEFFYYNLLTSNDSSHRFFKQMSDGDFKLIRYVEFKDGKEKIVYPFSKK